MSALMAEPRDVGRQESLFDALAPPRALKPVPPPAGDEDASRAEATVSYLRPRADEAERESADRSAPQDASPAADTTVAPADYAVRQQAASPTAPARPDAAARASAQPPVVGLREQAPAMDLTTVQGEPAVVEREVAGENAPRVAGAPLTRPTLDDVMSRVWEGLVTGLPAACPVCRHEVSPTLGGPAGGRCTSCGTVID
jgi:hypothetical protein